MVLAIFFWAVGPTWAGPLADKASDFDRRLTDRHTPLGMVIDLQPAPPGAPTRVAGGGDSTIWTGCYLAAQAYRYRVTGEPQALANMRKTLQGLVDLHAMTGCSGFLGRTFGPPEWYVGRTDMRPGIGSYSQFLFRPDTSRDQYTGIFLGLGLAWPHLTEGPLKDAVREMARAVGKNLVANDLALQVDLGDLRFQPFNLDPTYCYQDRLTPEEWERVDDFPANVLARWIPYNRDLAEVLSTFRPPPVRGGEALRALLMFHVASRMTEDPAITAFFTKELLGRRDFPRLASETSQLLTDIWDGRNDQVVERIFGDLWESFLDLALRGSLALDKLPPVWVRVLQVFAPPLARWEGMLWWRLIARGLRILREPGGMSVFGELAVLAKSFRNQYESFLGERRLRRLERGIDCLNRAAVSNLDEAADAQRSYVGTNLTFLALLGLMETDPPPELRHVARGLVDRAWEPIADEGKSFYTFIRAAHGSSPIPSHRMAEARRSLQIYPADQRNRRFDHRHDPGIRVLPWPDRFGQIGNLSATPFPISEQGPHIFIWQENPRKLVTGADNGIEVAPVGYLLAYWLGRYHGLLTPED